MKEKMLKILLVVLLVFSSVPRQIRADETEGSDVPEITQNETVHEEGEKETEDPVSEGEDKQDDLTLPAEEKDTEDPTEEDNKEPEAKIESVDDLLAEGLKEEDLEEEEDEEELYDRTILMYVVGSDLESVSGLASENLEQVLNARFSDGDQVKFIVMTGGSDENDGWHLDSSYLYDPATDSQLEEIDNEYNCIWEAKGLDAQDHPGKLVLLDGDGIMGDGENARKARPDDEDDEETEYEWMSDPEVLKAFINYGVENYPAEQYDLILWDHGGGPSSGYGMDEHSGTLMSSAKLIDVFSDNRVTEDGGKFDIINFDACLMNSIELTLAFAPYTDYYIASPELVPGDGEQYKGWLDMLGNDPDIDGFALGTKIVDDFYEYYEAGDGSDYEATMALVNTTALLNSGIVDALIHMNDLLSMQLNDALYYDELSSALHSVHYGNNSYYVDLGNLVAQLCVAVKEFDEDRIPAGGKDLEVNEYYDLALRIQRILHNETINYNCCTSGIHTSGEFLFRDIDGNLRYADDLTGQLSSSGTYIFFTAVDSFRDTEDYVRSINEILEVMSEGKVKQFLSEYRKTMVLYELMAKTGQTVTDMVNEGYDREKFDYDYVKAYWQIDTYEHEEDVDFSPWGLHVEDMVDLVLETTGMSGEDDPAFRDWMDDTIRQMAQEAIAKKNIELYEVKKEKGAGYRIRINDTKKRVIDNVSYNIIAELPILENWIEENDVGWMFMGPAHTQKELSIGMISGNEVFDMDLDSISQEDFTEEYIKWLNNDTAVWDLDALDEKWYALKDAEGRLHVVYMEMYNGYYLIPTSIETGRYDEYGDPIIEMVALFFVPDETSNTFDLSWFMIKEEGVYRPVQAKDLKRDLTLTPCMIVEGFISNYYAPISTEFTITAGKDDNNTDQIKLMFTDIENIPDSDIEDTTGDGKKLTKQIIITDIYGTQINITDMMENPDAYLTDIKLVTILDDEYTGHEMSPRIVYDGRILKEGVDYKLTKWTDDEVFQEVGRYTFELEGLGEFVGITLAKYNITPPAVQYLIIDGANAVWRKGSNKTCDFRFKRNFEDEKTFDLFESVLVDGEKVDSSSYTLEEGSVIIHLKPSFLQKLSVGDHSIKAVFADAESKAIRFTIRDKEEEKKHEPAHYIFPITGVERMYISR